ncbi:S-4TM family putative pore-forming effector [Pseudorhodoferax sp.]|uniref:S-4TM family putative pore-forming effector n=1 Tax=Pseudorhodoferax sp. TaxID=1993553 RepID=UPI0039E49CC4
MTTEHRIDIEQNKPERLELLRAQRCFYSRAKNYQNFVAITALMLPVLGLLFGAEFPTIRSYLGFASIALLLLDVAILSSKQRASSKAGAKVQEQFDTEVLKLDWNKLVAGNRMDPEELRAIAPDEMSDKEKKGLEAWYEGAISRLPLPLGRLLCQRTNVVYDLRVRRKYSAALFSIAGVLGVALFAVGLYQGLKLDELIISVALPVLPLVSFVLREYRKQEDTIESLTTLKGEIEKIWDKALAGASAEDLTLNSRALQDAIYRHRAGNPLVFDWLYNRLRKKTEAQAKHAVEKLVAEAVSKLNLSGV